MVAEGKEKQCRVCHCGFGASVWKYKCTDCAHYFCSSHCKDLWLRADDVDEDEEDPFTVLKDEEAPVDPSELPFPHGDGASVVSSVAPSAAGSSSGSKSSTRLLCIECYAPRRMALLRAELYHTLDDLEELSAHLPDAGADGAWKYIPSLAAMTPDAVSSGANVVSTAVGRSVGMGMGLLSGTSSVVMGGGSMVWGAARNAASTAVSVVPSADTLAAPTSTVKRVFSYFSSSRTPVSSPTVHTPPSSHAGTGVEGEEGVGGG